MDGGRDPARARISPPCRHPDGPGGRRAWTRDGGPVGASGPVDAAFICGGRRVALGVSGAQRPDASDRRCMASTGGRGCRGELRGDLGDPSDRRGPFPENLLDRGRCQRAGGAAVIVHSRPVGARRGALGHRMAMGRGGSALCRGRGRGPPHCAGPIRGGCTRRDGGATDVQRMGYGAVLLGPRG